MLDGGVADTAIKAGDAPIAPETLLRGISALARDELAPLADRIDREGFYPGALLARFGQAGAFAAHLSAHTPLPHRSLRTAIEAMAEIGAACMSSAFCAWCQDTAGWYLEHTANAALRARLQPGIASGAMMGGTGLSNPMKALAGIEAFALRARKVPRGYEVTGVLPWVSNLGDGHWFGTVFQNEDDPAHRMMAMVQCGQPGVEIRQSTHFIALEGTGTYAVRFRRAFIPEENLLADPLGDMPSRIRPGFTLLQTGMGFGVIDASVAAMRQADTTHGHTNRFLPRGPNYFADAAATLRERVLDLADQAGETPLRAVLAARLAVSELTLEATQAAVLHAGARGYIEAAAIARRQREGTFVAIITPSIRHLHQELATMGHA